MLQWMKRLNSKLYGASGEIEQPIVYDDTPPSGPLVAEGEEAKMWGRKVKMRLPSTRWDSTDDPYYHVVDSRFAAQRTKKIKWLANYNPRSPTVGRAPREWDNASAGGLSYFNPPMYHSETFSPNVSHNIYPIPLAESGDAYIGYSNEEGGTRAILFEIPKSTRATLSIGALAQAHLTTLHADNDDYWNTYPGTGGNAESGHGSANEDFFSDSLQPAFPIGNSLGDPRISASDAFGEETTSDRPIVVFRGTLYDFSYKLNEALWDRYFLSTVPREETLEKGPDGRYEPLPNSRLVPYNNPDLEKLRDFDEAAANLLLNGPLNVNSMSKEAWAALFGSYLGVQVNTADGTEPTAADESAFLHLSVPHGGAITAETEGRIIESEDAYTGYRKLSREEIHALAESMVAESARRRAEREHPFLHFADFVNRTLGGGDAAGDSPYSIHVRGALQQAIDNTSINDGFGTFANPGDDVIRIQDLDPAFENRAAAAGSTAEGVPGYLTQATVLARLGSVLTTRGDTFLVRAYGEAPAREAGEPAEMTWCEAVVQRLPEYVDPVDPPWTAPQDLTSDANGELGRRFVVTHFRWLAPEDL